MPEYHGNLLCIVLFRFTKFTIFISGAFSNGMNHNYLSPHEVSRPTKVNYGVSL